MERDLYHNRLRDLREDRDLRQTDVAAATGIDQRTLSNYETGKTVPDAIAVIALAKFFNVSCDYLLGVTETDINAPTVVIRELEDIKKRLDGIQRYLNRR